VKYTCMSCAARYAIPDARVSAAGAGGLRVRCVRCRAIMSVSSSSVAASADGAGDFGGAQLAETGVHALSSLDVGPPSIAEASRHVTGVFQMMLEDAAVAPAVVRVWYAAIGGRTRGPFSPAEMLTLARRGKLRRTTLLWRGGMESWAALEQVPSHEAPGLTAAVLERRAREAQAQQQAAAHGIPSLNLQRMTVPTSGTVPPMPVDSMPPRPAHDDGAMAALEPIAAPLARDRGQRAVVTASERQQAWMWTMVVIAVLALATAVAWPALADVLHL
jgi:predicted Zn finger-like uncharacterized protein